MTKAMAIDHGPQGIRVNCVCPGDVDTPILPADAQMRGMDWETYWRHVPTGPSAGSGPSMKSPRRSCSSHPTTPRS